MSEQKQIEAPDNSVLERGTTPFDIVRYVLVLTIVGIGIWYFYFKTPPQFVSREAKGKTMGTFYSVKIPAFPKSNDPDDWPKFQQKIQDRLDEIDRAMSTFKDDSDVSRFNASDSDDWIDVSADTAYVVETAQRVSAMSEGAFDITIGPLVDLWGFGPGAQRKSLVELKEKTREIKSRIGFDKLEVRREPPALKKSIPELRIDLSAIAKGFAVDEVANLLECHKLNDYMIEVGGEVRCRGSKHELGQWAVGIENPLITPPGEFPGVARKIYLGDRSLATSGDYQNFREIENVRFSHILDPRTGFPVERVEKDVTEPLERLGSVSVISESCMFADAWATALFVLGEEKGLEIAEKHKLAVLYLFRTGKKDEPIREAASTIFP